MKKDHPAPTPKGHAGKGPLPRADYGGTGKRLFIGLAAGSALLVCALLLLFWLVPTLGFAGIHPLLPYISGALVGLAMAGVLWVAVGLGLYASTGRRPRWGAQRLWLVTARLLLPLMEVVGRFGGISVEAVRRSFIKVNNELVYGSGLKCDPSSMLILLPHCIQASRCERRLNFRVDNCTRCGACPLKDLLTLRDRWGVRLAMAVGGTIARRIVVDVRPKLILAVACERDLASGIQDTCPLPVFGVINERPAGPCVDTLVSVDKLEAAIRHFSSRPPADEVGGADEVSTAGMTVQGEPGTTGETRTTGELGATDSTATTAPGRAAL